MKREKNSHVFEIQTDIIDYFKVMTETMQRIKERMEELGISARRLANSMKIGERAMQQRLNSGTFNIEELERLEELLSIKLLAYNAQAESAHVSEPAQEYGRQPINIIINLGDHSDSPFAQKLEESLLSFLAQEHKNGGKKKG